MDKRANSVGIIGFGLALGVGIGCDLVQGLQPATLVEAGGGGHGGSGGAGASGATTSSGGTTTATVCQPGTSIACYTGPTGSEGVGMCKGGMRACNADGSGYEDVCQGEVHPAAESCASTADEDCDKLDCARWAVVFGDPAAQRPLDIKSDGDGNTYVLGAFQGALDVVNPALVTAGQNDLFLVKIDPAGKVVWARQYGDSADQMNGTLAVDAGGNIAIVAKFDGLLDFGMGNLGPGGTAVARIGPGGNTLWSISFAPKLSARVALSKDANVIVWLTFSGKVDFGTGLLDAGVFTDVALLQLSGVDGKTVWAKQFGYSGNVDSENGIAIDGGNNIVVSGSFVTKIDLGGGDLMAQSGTSELFVGRFDKNGAYAVGSSYSGLDGAKSMTLDSIGGTLFSAVYEYAPFTYSSVLKKVDNMVVEAWSKQFESAGMAPFSTTIESLAAAPNDDVVLAFTADGPNDFGSGGLPPIGTDDLILGKLDGVDGHHLWSRRFGAPGAAQGAPVVATAPNGDILLAAKVSGTIDVGTGPIVTKGQDLLIARFAP